MVIKCLYNTQLVNQGINTTKTKGINQNEKNNTNKRKRFY